VCAFLDSIVERKVREKKKGIRGGWVIPQGLEATPLDKIFATQRNIDCDLLYIF
jgi:malate synthase